MKNTLIKFAGVATVAFALVQSLQAAPISGTIGFTGNVTLNSGSASTATAVVAWGNPTPVTVTTATGSFATVSAGTAVTGLGAWTFNFPSVSTPTFSWSVGGFTFNLASSSIISQGGVAGVSGYVNVSGTGTVSGNGYTPTTLIWSFSTQDPAVIGGANGIFTFSSSHTTVPDGGATVALLGLALTGAGLLRKKLVA